MNKSLEEKMIKKEFKNEEEVVSIDDLRVENWLKEKYGNWHSAIMESFSINKETCKDLLKIMKKNKIDKLWGDYLTLSFDKKEVSFLKLVGNKKLFGLVTNVQSNLQEGQN
jgi:hypothetical protein